MKNTIIILIAIALFPGCRKDKEGPKADLYTVHANDAVSFQANNKDGVSMTYLVRENKPSQEVMKLALEKGIKIYTSDTVRINIYNNDDIIKVYDSCYNCTISLP